jgi:PAS domain S-box-containing protein
MRKGKKVGQAIFETFYFSHFSLFISFLVFSFFFLFGCGDSSHLVDVQNEEKSPFASYRDIPDVTAEEITDIEALRRQTSAFIYGTTPNSESFVGDDGKVHGFTALFCEWMTDLFGITFKPTTYAWGDLVNGLGTGEVDFTGELTPTEGRRETYFMTPAIAERTIRYFRINDSPSFEEVARLHPLRYAFLSGTTTWQAVTASFSDLDYETVFVDDSSLVYDMLKSGEVDAFFNEGPGEYIFDVYGDVVSYSFVPLIFESVSLATRNADLSPIISVMQKAIVNGGRNYISHLYNRGYLDYQKYKLNMRLNADERDYLRNNSHIRLAAEYDAYPISFYNNYEKEWQGIAFDILHNIEQLTGLKVDLVNGQNTEWPELLEMIRNNKAAMITQLLRTDDRSGKYVWTKNIIISDNFALLSKSEYPNLSLNDVMNVRVALMRDTAYAELFKRWFVNHAHIFEYSTHIQAFEALQKGDVDVVMSDRKDLLFLSNFSELPGYKVNFVFDRMAEITFGFNEGEATLAGIIDKALMLMDLDEISSNWIFKTYDYKAKLLEAQRPWLIGAIGLSLTVLGLLLVLIYRIINEEKRLKKIVEEKTSTLTAILDTTPDIIYFKDTNSITMDCNKALEKYFNVPKKKIIGRPDTEALGWTLEAQERHIATDKRVFNEERMVIVEEYIQPHSGEPRLFETIKTPLIQEGKVTGLVGMSRDITRRKAAEEEAKKASAEAMKAYASAETASKAKSRFIANMSHEMRTPMNVIVGLTDLLLEEDDVTGKTRETLEKINTAGDTLMALINDVLDISKIEAGKLELMPVPYDMVSLLNDIIALNIIRIEEKPISFKLDISEELPCSLFGDDMRIKQILNNLLSNAFKFTKNGTVTLGVECRREKDEVHVSFSVSDTGIGVREEDLAKLFTDYNQVDNLANREIEGTGLGLSITKRFVELMGGEITVESEYGKGSTFRMRIRQGFITDQVLGRETVQRLCGLHYLDKKKKPQGKFSRPDLSYARVLVVDDFPTNLDVAAGMLRKYKMQVDCVMGGREAVSRITAGDPVYNAVFMDHMMPDMDGMEATAAIRALETAYAHNIPIIALTANVVDGNGQMFLDNGFDAYLPKPFSVMSLDSVVQRWIMDKDRNKG